jgi:hypothetical protein
MKINLFSITFTLSLYLLIISPVFASTVEFDAFGKCDITGTIKAVDFEEAYKDPCIESNSCPVGAFEPERSAHYNLSIYINTLNCTPGEIDNPITYESQFELNNENAIILNLVDTNEGDQFQAGTNISGTIEFKTLAHTFTSYELEGSGAQINTNDIFNQNPISENHQDSKNQGYLSVAVVIAIIILVVVGFILIRRK